MVGEMDYTDLLTTNVVGDVKVPGTNIPYVPLPALSYIMFTLFVLLVSIILMNLLVSHVVFKRVAQRGFHSRVSVMFVFVSLFLCWKHSVSFKLSPFWSPSCPFYISLFKPYS